MPVSVLKETTMSRKKRTLLRVELVDEEETETAFSELMGKESAPRFRFIQANSAGFELDV
jgi:topoisomerase-4 subunit B